MLLGLTGKARSGKTTAAKWLGNKYNFVIVTIADPIRKVVQDVFDFANDQVYENKDVPDHRYPKSNRYDFLTPREAMQSLGDWGRQCYEGTWINVAISDALKEPDSVIEDVRLDLEAAEVRKAGGKIVEIVRPGAGLQGKFGEHITEQGVSASLIDYTISNDGDIHILRLRVATMLDVLKGKILAYDEEQQDVPPFMRKK